MKISPKSTIIAGPCAAEDRQQILKTAKVISYSGVSIMRASLWKPRTNPGFSGVGIDGLDWLIEAAETYNLTIATEIMLPQHIVDISKRIKNKPIKIIFWIGSRNQNHLIQQAIAREILKKTPHAKLMVKNQPWKNYRHWKGIVDHVLSTGFHKENLLVCHRGFQPDLQNNVHNFRNLPDLLMMDKIKKETGLPMIFDASHIGGSKKNVFTAINYLIKSNASTDGLMIEIHPNPKQAKTDAQQQLNFSEFEKLINTLLSSADHP